MVRCLQNLLLFQNFDYYFGRLYTLFTAPPGQKCSVPKGNFRTVVKTFSVYSAQISAFTGTARLYFEYEAYLLAMARRAVIMHDYS